MDEVFRLIRVALQFAGANPVTAVSLAAFAVLALALVTLLAVIQKMN